MKHKKLTQHKIDLLSRQVCNLTEEQQIEELLVLSDDYGKRNEVIRVSKLFSWMHAPLVQYQNAYLNVIHGAKRNAL